MKNNKKSPQTLLRQARFIEEFGADFKTVTKPTEDFNQLTKELIGVDTEEQKRSRIAMESTSQGYRENNPENYRNKTRVHPRTGVVYDANRTKFFESMGAVQVHEAKEDCQAEANEFEKLTVGAASHVGNHEEPIPVR